MKKIYRSSIVKPWNRIWYGVIYRNLLWRFSRNLISHSGKFHFLLIFSLSLPFKMVSIALVFDLLRVHKWPALIEECKAVLCVFFSSTDFIVKLIALAQWGQCGRRLLFIHLIGVILDCSLFQANLMCGWANNDRFISKMSYIVSSLKIFKLAGIFFQ